MNTRSLRPLCLSLLLDVLVLSRPGIAQPSRAFDEPGGSPGSIPAGVELAASADGSWSPLVIAQRKDHSAIYDAARDRMIVFGGADVARAFDDMWSLSLNGALAWTRLVPGGPGPGFRSGHSAIYDPVRERMLVFGGTSPAGTSNEVWALSLSGGTPAWTRLTPDGTLPAARRKHTAIYDPVRDRMIVFGGEDGALHPMGDVWALSLAGAPTWTALAPGGAVPNPRFGHTSIYDPVRDRMLVFAGRSGSGLPYSFSDVWALTLAGTPSWTMLQPEGAPPHDRAGHAAIYDPAGDRMVVFSGGDTYAGYRNDTWALSLAGTPAWTQLAPAGTPPAVRADLSAIYDPMRGRMVVFGGGLWKTWYGEIPYNDVGMLTLAGAGEWNVVAPSGVSPAPQRSHTAIYDPAGRRMVMFGRDAERRTSEVRALSLDTYPAWTELATPIAPRPGARDEEAAIYDPLRHRLLIFGGHELNVGDLNDVWALSLTGAPAWTQLVPEGTPPSVRQGHSAIYDPVRDRMVIYGGYNSDGNLGDAWALSLAGTPAWTKLAEGVTRYWHSAIYDPVRDCMTVFGGMADGIIQNDVASLSLRSTPAWLPLAPGGAAPSLRFGQSAVYDPVRNRMVVFGGRSVDGKANDVWALSFLGPVWTRLAPSGTLPIERFGASGIYDPLHDRLVLCGGECASAALNDVWSLEWGSPAIAAAHCPAAAEWSAGDSLLLRYEVTNPYAFAQTADYALTSARQWPGFPIVGSIAAKSGTTALTVLAPVPDTAAAGANELTFHVRLRGLPEDAECAHEITAPPNRAPDCSGASLSVTELWPPDGRMVPVRVLGVSDPDGDPVTLTYAVTQDEPLERNVTGRSCADAAVVDGVLELRAERSGEGNGRVYRVRFVADDGNGATCEGDAIVTVPHDQGRGHIAVDDGLLYDAMAACVPKLGADRAPGEDRGIPATLSLAVVRSNGSEVAFEYGLPRDADVQLGVFDLLGRRVAALVSEREPAGMHRASWSLSGVRSGIYYCRVQSGAQRMTRSVLILR